MRFTLPPRLQPYRNPSLRRSRKAVRRTVAAPLFQSALFPVSLTAGPIRPSRDLMLSSILASIFSPTLSKLSPQRPDEGAAASVSPLSILSSSFLQKSITRPVTPWAYATANIRPGCWVCFGCGFVISPNKPRCPECLQRRGEPQNTLLIDQWRCTGCGNIHDTAKHAGKSASRKKQRANSPLAGLEHNCNSCGKRPWCAEEYALHIEREEALLQDALDHIISLEEARQGTNRFTRKEAVAHPGHDVDGSASYPGGGSRYIGKMLELEDPDLVVSVLTDDMLWRASIGDEGSEALVVEALDETAMLREDEIDTLNARHSLERHLDTKSRLYEEGKAASVGGGVRTPDTLRQAEEHGDRLRAGRMSHLEKSFRKTAPAMYAVFATSLSLITPAASYGRDIVMRGCGTVYSEQHTDEQHTPKRDPPVSALGLSQVEKESLQSILRNTEHRPVNKAYPNCLDARLVVIRPKWPCPLCKHSNSVAAEVCSRCKRVRPT